MIETLGFDGDDTLWHNETMFSLTQERFCDLIAPYSDEADVLSQLLATEQRNLQVFGYGVKGFTLSMIETAIEVTDGQVPARVIEQILEAGRAMLHRPIELLPGVEVVLGTLSAAYRLLLITKGDLFDQESKIARSGLGDHFDGIEIISEKDADAYAAIFAKHGIHADRFVMVGNSLRSDVLPVVENGARAVYIPYEVTWEHEHSEDLTAATADRMFELSSIRDLPALLRSMS